MLLSVTVILKNTAVHVCACVRVRVQVNAFSLYCLLTRPLLKKYPPIFITGVSFVIVVPLLLAAALVLLYAPGVHIIPDSNQTNPWSMTTTASYSLAYFVVVYSILLYSTINWANNYIPASTITAYTVVQPVTAGLLSLVLIMAGFNDSHTDVQLHEPSWNAFGCIGVFAGLFLIVYSDVAARRQQGKHGAVPAPGKPDHTRDNTSDKGSETSPLLINDDASPKRLV